MPRLLIKRYLRAGFDYTGRRQDPGWLVGPHPSVLPGAGIGGRAGAGVNFQSCESRGELGLRKLLGPVSEPQ